MLMVLALLASAFGARVSAQSTPVAQPATPQVTTGDDKAAFTFVQASSSMVTVDVMIDDQVVLSGVKFGSVSEYLTVDKGKHTFKVVPAGGDSSQGIASADITTDSGKIYDVVAAGPSDKVELKSFEMLLDPVSADNVRLRVIDAANTGDKLDLAPTMPAGSDPILKGTDYFNASDHVDFRAGDINLELRKSGEEGSLIQLPTFHAEAGSVVDIIVTTDAQNNLVPILVGAQAGSDQNPTQVASPEA